MAGLCSHSQDLAFERGDRVIEIPKDMWGVVHGCRPIMDFG
jgi:hypothetical protein